MHVVHKNGETGELAVDSFDDPDNFIAVVVAVQYAADVPVTCKWYDVERSMDHITSCVSAVQLATRHVPYCTYFP